MERVWIDVRDEKEWTVEGIYVMPIQEPGEPIPMMGPEVPLRITFGSKLERHQIVARLDQPLDELPDFAIASLLDEARRQPLAD